MMWRMEATISSVSSAYNEHMKRLFEQNHFVYSYLPPIMDLIRDAIVVVPLRTSSTTVAAKSEVPAPEVPV